MKQIAKIFSMNSTRSGQFMIDQQINNYLENHPECEIKSAAYTSAGVYEKALVIFVEREKEKAEKHERPERQNSKGDIIRKNYNL